jgi:hypothetical protein
MGSMFPRRGKKKLIVAASQTIRKKLATRVAK